MLNNNLKWRYATKKFDKSKMISENNLEVLKENTLLSPSSWGLQPYKVIIVSNDKLKEKLKSASYEQDQITDCSHLFVFCNYVNVTERDVDSFLELKAETENTNLESLSNISEKIKNKIKSKSPEDLSDWTARQAYLGLGFLLASAAELRIDACPMEGFEPEKYNSILKLEDKGLNSVVIAAVGYRDENDPYLNKKKVRKDKDFFFINF